MEPEEQQPIIIIKKKGGHGGHHGGSWKVAYADFITALMAFFLVMWLVGQDQVIKDNVAGYFNDPASWGKKGSGSILKGGPSIAIKSLLQSPQSRAAEERSRRMLQGVGNRILKLMQNIPEFESIKEHIKIEMTPEGLRIQLIEAAATTDDLSYFFDLGSSRLSQKGTVILTVIARELGKLDNKVVVEGHTDNRKYIYKQRYSNWELSADRANSSRKLMEEKGLYEGQVFEIRGYAANRPMIKENPLDARNRRIAILVLINDPSLKKPPENEPIARGLPPIDVIQKAESLGQGEI